MRNPPTERLLDDAGVRWEYVESFDLADIDGKASLQNQARLEPLDANVVEQYAIDAKKGDDFPALMVWMRPRSAPILLGGNHRYNAFEKAGKSEHDIYKVYCDPDMATPLAYADNRHHGLPPSADERCAQALHLIEMKGWNATKAAQWVGTTVMRLNLYRALTSADQRAKTLRIERFDKVPKSVRARLDALTADPVFAETAGLVVTASMNQDAVFNLVTRLNEAADDDARLRIVDKERALWRGQLRDASGTTKMQPTDRNRAMDAVNRLSRCHPRSVADACVDREQARLLAQTFTSGKRQLDELVRALQERWT